MQRLFVAIRLPASIRAWLLDAMGGISGARWQRDDQLHLTLRFIGEVDRHTARDIDAALAAVRQQPFEIALSGVGAFDRRGRPYAVWAGVTPPAELERLHKKIDQALVRRGLAPEGRAYVPHVTLARLNRSAGPIGHLLDAASSLASPPFAVEAFGLFESALTPDGAVYAETASYPLG
jgi:2'-5' RNA ligase